MANLYELSTKYIDAERMLNDAQTDLEYEQALDHLIDVEANLSDKIDNTARFIQNLTGEIDKFKNEENRIKNKRISLENKQKRLKEFVLNTLENHNIEYIKGENFSVKLQDNSQYSMSIEDEELIPSEYFEDVSVLKKDELKTDILDNGLYVEGVMLKKGKHIRIR